MSPLTRDPQSHDQRTEWGMCITYYLLEKASDFVRELHMLNQEQMVLEFWTLISEAYEAGRLNPRLLDNRQENGDI